jgi:hypothetical protein
MMKRIWLLWCLAFLATGCSAIIPTYQEPQDGPRAKVRVIYGGAAAKFYPGRDCQVEGSDPGLDVSGFRLPIPGTGRKLNMPAPPQDGRYFEEVFVPAGEPLTTRFVRRDETHAGSKVCVTPAFTFVPEPAAHYEMTFSIAPDFMSCESSLARIVEDQPGEYRREPMSPRAPAAVPCHQ